MRDSLFVEFNLDAKLVGSYRVKEAKSEILGIDPIRIRAYTFNTLLAKKIKAFYERGSGINNRL
ncbi:MAG: hypothetical protein ACUVWK_04185 [Nitrososphaerales archaeon]